jgi:type IV fimbrial biogenesis protein FimT
MIQRQDRGFSLLELLVVITIIAILVALAVPNYRTWIANTKVRTAAESIQNGLRTARNEAAQRGINVRFELSSTTDSSWVVCTLPTGKTVCTDTGAVTIEQHPVGESAGVVVTGSKLVAKLTNFSAVTGGLPGGITFSPLARPLPADYNKNALLRIDTQSTAPNTRRLATTITAGGSVQMCDAGLSKTTAANGCLP